jgi:hypothetical protein
LRHRASRALAELGAAAPLGAVCLLAANDHQFKRLFHNSLTGKLSDVAICFLLPLIVSAALGLVCGWHGRRRLAVGAVVATFAFTLLELSDTAGALFVRATRAFGLGGGTLTRDATDLLALVCVPLAVAYGRRRLTAAERGPNVWRSATGALVLATGSLALMATSMSVMPCNKWSAPVVFQADAGCGPGGLIVVTPDGTHASGTPTYYNNLRISNAAALGLDAYQAGYVGFACPLTLDQGGWGVSVMGCPSVDGGADGGVDGGVDGGQRGTECTPTTIETCSAELTGGTLMYTCGSTCRSRLTVVPP